MNRFLPYMAALVILVSSAVPAFAVVDSGAPPSVGGGISGNLVASGLSGSVEPVEPVELQETAVDALLAADAGTVGDYLGAIVLFIGLAVGVGLSFIFTYGW